MTVFAYMCRKVVFCTHAFGVFWETDRCALSRATTQRRNEKYQAWRRRGVARNQTTHYLAQRRNGATKNIKRGDVAAWRETKLRTASRYGATKNRVCFVNLFGTGKPSGIWLKNAFGRGGCTQNLPSLGDLESLCTDRPVPQMNGCRIIKC